MIYFLFYPLCYPTFSFVIVSNTDSALLPLQRTTPYFRFTERERKCWKLWESRQRLSHWCNGCPRTRGLTTQSTFARISSITEKSRLTIDDQALHDLFNHTYIHSLRVTRSLSIADSIPFSKTEFNVQLVSLILRYFVDESVADKLKKGSAAVSYWVVLYFLWGFGRRLQLDCRMYW